jgi:hypothetical protein
MESIKQTVGADEAAYGNAVADLMRLDPDIVFHCNPSVDNSEPLRGVILGGLASDVKRLTQISQTNKTEINQ